MSKVLRASSVVVAAALAVPLWAVPSALADEVSEKATNGAYFYSAGIAKPDAAPAAPPNLTGDNADGVAARNLAVASQGGGQEDKVSFLGFDLASVPLDATIDKAVLTVPLVPNNPPSNISAGAAPELVRACAAGDSGFFGEDGTSMTLAPERLCDQFSSEPATLSEDGNAYVFDITGLAATWLTANDGVALTVAEGAAAPFQVVFAPFAEASLALSFTALAPLEELPVDTGSSEVPLAGGFDTGGSLPTFETGGFGTVDAPVVDTALPEPAPMAQAAPEPAVAAPITNVSAMTEASLTPSTSFWVGLLALVGIAALLSLIMGDTRVTPAAATTSQSRLSKALQGRESAAARGPRLARPVAL